MKTDAELEHLIRTTFAGRVTTLPPVRPWSPETVQDLPPSRRPWLAAVAAAAAVIAVAGAVVVARNASHHAAQPGHHTVTPSPTHTPSPSPTTSHHVAPPIVSTAACATSLPSGWRSALASSAQNVGPYSAFVLSVTSDGGVLVLEDSGVTPGSPRQVVELRSGQSPAVLYTVSNPDKISVSGADKVGHWLLLAFADAPRAPKGVEPGSSPIGLNSIAVLDLNTHKLTQLGTTQNATGGRSIKSSVVFDGRIYWDEETTYAAQTDVVKAYDPTTGQTRTVYSGALGWLTGTPLGVISDLQGTPVVVAPASLPPVVAAAQTDFSKFRIGSDGTAYAWLTSPTVVGWWRPGMANPVYVRVKTAFDTQNNRGAPTVAGQFVFNGTPGVLLDMKTTAVATLTNGDFSGVIDPYLGMGVGGVALGSARADGNGAFVGGYWTDPASKVLRVDTAGLPDLHC